MGTGHGFVVTQPQWPWRCNVVNDGDLAEFVSFTGLILTLGDGEHYDSDRILTTPAPKSEEAEEKSSRQ